MTTKDKQQKLKETLSNIHKTHGKESVNIYSQMPKIDVEAIPTGSLGLDMALGVGGLARGRIVELYGLKSSGKTTLTLHVIAACQKAGGLCAFIDAEHALDPEYATELGVDMDNLVLSQPDNGEQALNIAEELAESGVLDVIVIDSVAALTPRAEIEGEVGDHFMGLQARMMSQACRKLASAVNRTKTVLVFINQIRQKIGISFGSNETTTGGNALKFYASQRLDIRRISTVKDGDHAVAIRSRVKVVKNKVAPPFKQAEFQINFGQGIDKEREVLEHAISLGLVEKSGAWYTVDGDRFQGLDNTLNHLRSKEGALQRLETQVREVCGMKVRTND